MQGDTRTLNAVVALLIRTGHLDEHERLMTSWPEEDQMIIDDYVDRHRAGAQSPAIDPGCLRAVKEPSVVHLGVAVQ
jgi:hypothetical protein